MSFRVWSICRNSIFKTNLIIINRNYQNQPNYSQFDHQSQDDDRRHEPVLRLYPEHIPTTTTQKVLLSLGSAISAITDPHRDGIIRLITNIFKYLLIIHSQRYGRSFW